MNKAFSEQEVLDLLDHLKGAGNEYPSEMIRSRRDIFVKQASAMAALTGPSGGNGSGPAGSISSSLESFTLSRLLELALVLVLAAGAGIAAFIYRDTISDFVNSTLFPKTEPTAVSSQDPSVEPASLPAAGEENSSDTSEAVPSLTPSPFATLTSTPIPSLAPGAGQNTDKAEDTNPEGIQPENVAGDQSTPTPKDGSGLHLGQTPKPERTLPANENSPPNKDDNSSKKDKSP